MLDVNYGVPEIHGLHSNEIESESEDFFQAEWSQKLNSLTGVEPQLSALSESWAAPQDQGWPEASPQVPRLGRSSRTNGMFVRHTGLKEFHDKKVIAGLRLEAPMADKYETFGPKVSAIPGEAPEEQSSQEAVDQRPHIFDPILQKFLLVDSGSQITAWSPDPGDKPIKGRHLRAVNGSKIKCFGTKEVWVKIGRKEYRFTAIKAEVDSPVVGWDFMRKHRLDLVWNDDGENILVDKKAKIEYKLKFKGLPHQQSDS